MKNLFRFPEISKRHATIWKIVIVLLALLLLCGIVLLVISQLDINPNVQNATTSPTVDSTNAAQQIYGSDGKLYQRTSQIETVLLLGIDKYEDNSQGSYINNQQADAIMLLVVDHAKMEYTVLQINRDTITSIQTLGVTGESSGKINAQVALAHAYGTGGVDSCNNTVHAVENLLYGIDIEYFASIKLDAVPLLNDAVGGVTLTLMDDFTSLDPGFTDGATVTLMGSQATAYIQYRGSLENNTNIHRMERQKQYMSAWVDRFFEAHKTDGTLASSLIADIQSYMVTNMNDPDKIDRLAECFETYTSKGIRALEGESVKGEKYMEFHVDEVALERLVLDLFYDPVNE